MIYYNSLKTQDIRCKLVAFESNRLTLQVNHKNNYLLLKNNFYSQKMSIFEPLAYQIEET